MKVVSLFGRQFSSWSSYRRLGPSGTFFVASRKHRPYPRSLAGTACEGLIELGSCDRVPRSNIEADKIFFSYAGGNKKRHFVL